MWFLLNQFLLPLPLTPPLASYKRFFNIKFHLWNICNEIIIFNEKKLIISLESTVLMTNMENKTSYSKIKYIYDHHISIISFHLYEPWNLTGPLSPLQSQSIQFNYRVS